MMSAMTETARKKQRSVPPPAHMLAVVMAARGRNKAEIAKDLHVSRMTFLLWDKGQLGKLGQESRLLEMYLAEPLTEPVESLGLTDPNRCSMALRAMQRKLRLSQRQLGETIGVSENTARNYLINAYRPNHKCLRRIAEACREHKISPRDIEAETAAPEPFSRLKNKFKNEQILFVEGKPDDVRDILRRAKEETGTEFRHMADCMGISRKFFYHLTREGGQRPNMETQEKIFGYLRDLYENAGVKFPFVLGPPRLGF